MQKKLNFSVSSLHVYFASRFEWENQTKTARNLVEYVRKHIT